MKLEYRVLWERAGRPVRVGIVSVREGESLTVSLVTSANDTLEQVELRVRRLPHGTLVAEVFCDIPTIPWSHWGPLP